MSDPANPPEGGPANSGEAVSIVDAEGNFSESYLEHFDEGDRPTLARFAKTGLKSLGKSYSDLQRQFRSPDDYVKIPKEDSSDEDRADFHRRRGVPDDVKDYKYEQPETLNENIQTTDEEMALYFQLAKDANLTPAQFKIMADGHFANLEKRHTAQTLIQQEAEDREYDFGMETLTKLLGKSKDERVARANAVLNKYGNRELKNEKGEAVGTVLEKLFETYPKLKRSPWMTMIVDSVAEDMSEDRIKGITTTTIPTSETIESKMNELRNKPGYYDKSHEDHQKIMDERKRLAQLRNS